MPHLISNLYEKNYTPFTAKLAPRDLCNRPSMGRLVFLHSSIIGMLKITNFIFILDNILTFYVCIFNSEKAIKGIKTRS